VIDRILTHVKVPREPVPSDEPAALYDGDRVSCRSSRATPSRGSSSEGPLPWKLPGKWHGQRSSRR